MTDRPTYSETINRYVVEACEIITDPRRRAEYRINGLDPDDHWTLVWSFETYREARRQEIIDRSRNRDIRHYRTRDLGAAQVIERSVW